ncbi:MAG: hypothetical protein ACOC33_01885 [bacterium]
MMNFYNELIKHYSRISFPEQYLKICQIDGPISWYFADDSDQFISVDGIGDNQKLIEIDIKSAFPTICRNLLSKDYPDFIKQMDSINDKKQRNIFIATTLKDTPYLRQLNTISKLIISGYIFDISNNSTVLLLELKKDGCIVFMDYEQYDEILHNKNKPFINFLLSNGFNFHIDTYLKYLRSDKTTTVLKESNNDYELIIKGIYKYLPSYIIDINKAILCDENPDLDQLNKIYSIDYYNIIKRNNLSDLLENYYICSNNCVLNNMGKYEKIKISNNIYPRLYLEKFIHPVLLGQKLK